MPETPSTAVAVQPEAVRTSVFGIVHAAGQSTQRFGAIAVDSAGRWAGDVAQEFGTLLSDLLAPIVFTMYAITLWSLATSFGWTDTFVFSAGPLRNWLVWLGMTILLNVAASILKRHISDSTQP